MSLVKPLLCSEQFWKRGYVVLLCSTELPHHGDTTVFGCRCHVCGHPQRSGTARRAAAELLQECKIADGVIRDILERSMDVLRIVFVACVVDGHDAGAVCRILCNHIGETVEARCTTPELCRVKCLYASSDPPSAASISLTIAVPSALPAQ